jgi:HD-like signal output (HDOD) protein
MKKFWMHSVATGVFARLLAHHKPGLPEEDLFIAGLLHDIGRLVIFKALPRTAAFAIQRSIIERTPLFQIEKEIFSYDHAEVAGLLLEKWNFPKPLQQLIRYHHSPLDCQRPVEAAIIYLANVLASAMRFGSSGNYLIPCLDKETWDVLELTPSVLMPCIQQFDRQVDEVLHIFHLDQDSDKKR